MPSPIRSQVARSIGVAGASLLLIVGGAFAANNIAGTLAPRDETVNVASPGATESPEATDDSAHDGAGSSAEPSESPEASDAVGAAGSQDGNEDEDASEGNDTDGDSGHADDSSGSGAHQGGDSNVPRSSDDPSGDD